MATKRKPKEKLQTFEELYNLLPDKPIPPKTITVKDGMPLDELELLLSGIPVDTPDVIIEPLPDDNAFLTKAAQVLNLCQYQEHWTVSLSNWFLPVNGCACCLFFRGALTGVLIGSIATIIGAVIINFI